METLDKLMDFLRMGQAKGSYTLADAEKILESQAFLKAKNKSKDPKSSMTSDQALGFLVQAAEVAQKNGAYTFEEAFDVLKIIRELKKILNLNQV